jgi:glucose-6-phosphate-specific signal transduction histidine kinase
MILHVPTGGPGGAVRQDILTSEDLGGPDPGGSGLAGLRERAEALGGTLQLTSPPDRGTSLYVRLPAVPR